MNRYLYIYILTSLRNIYEVVHLKRRKELFSQMQYFEKKKQDTNDAS